MLDVLLRLRRARTAPRPALAAAACVAMLAIAGPARATWPPATQNLPVCTVTGAQNYRTAISDGEGGMFVAWSDARYSITDIYVQHVLAEGSLAWLSTGAPACLATGRQDQVVLTRDGAGGIILAWRDYRNSQDGDIYAQRVDSTGVIRWLYNGVRVCVAPGQQQWPVICGDSLADSTGAHGAYVAWEDDRDAPRIYAQHLDYDGTPAWAVDGVPVSSSFAAQYQPAMICDHAGGAILAWSQQSADDYDVWAQHMDSTATGLWGAAGTRVCGAGGDQFWPVVVADTSRGVWVGWQDGRGASQAVYAQHLGADGSAWLATDGVPLCAAGSDQLSPAFAADGGGGLFATWTDGRSGGSDLYAQHVDALGFQQWDPLGVAIVTGGGGHTFPTMAADGNGGMFAAWEDTRTGGSDIYAQQLDATGSAQWTVGGAAISTAASNQYQATIVSSGDGTGVIVWSDLRGGNVDLFAQRVPLDAASMAQRSPRTLASSPNPARDVATLAFEVAAPARAQLVIFDCAGRRVRTVADAEFTAGSHRVAWDARDDGGRRCPEGVYFARLAVGGRTVATRTLALAR